MREPGFWIARFEEKFLAGEARPSSRLSGPHELHAVVVQHVVDQHVVTAGGLDNIFVVQTKFRIVTYLQLPFAAVPRLQDVMYVDRFAFVLEEAGEYPIATTPYGDKSLSADGRRPGVIA
jgi:hypothetical protein